MKNICDTFGFVDPKTIPSESIYFDKELQKKAIITDKLKTVSLDYLTNAVKIQNESDLIEFQKLYSEVCLGGNSGIPAVFEKIEFVIKEKQKLAQGILKNINPEDVVEVAIPNNTSEFDNKLDGIKYLLRRLGQIPTLDSYGGEPNENLRKFVEAHFNDIEYKLYNSLKYNGDEFSFKESIESLHKIKKSKKYLYIRINPLELTDLFYEWKEYDFKTQTFSTKFPDEWEKDDRFDMPKDLQVKIPANEAKDFKRNYIKRDGSIDYQLGTKDRYLQVELLFKIENGLEDKIAWGDCSDDIIYWSKPPIGTTCKVRMDLRRKKLNLIPIRYRIENSRDSKVYQNY
ncbi:hypothetical protein [Leptospira kmetyi]|uniref:Uncharacterized protein n=1 Tax=Leptospira kmetyi TaxID=408139 RepID=A0ABX4N517_9LEPT|nr:hypothetical protein [Leptospira kmetyi]PJZ28410.1 hypothetical protein CH378_18085 [Leptospira kmetyi]